MHCACVPSSAGVAAVASTRARCACAARRRLPRRLQACTELAQQLAEDGSRPIEYISTLVRLGSAELGRGNISDAQVRFDCVSSTAANVKVFWSAAVRMQLRAQRRYHACCVVCGSAPAPLARGATSRARNAAFAVQRQQAAGL